MPAPDLTRAQRRIEELMVDRCRITRDVEGTDDDTLDSGTLALVPPAGDKIVIYEGPCKLSAARGSVGTSERPVSEGDVHEWARHYMLGIPLTAPVPQAADAVTMLTSRDPAAVDLVLRVVGSTFGTFKLSRQVEVEARSGGA